MIRTVSKIRPGSAVGMWKTIYWLDMNEIHIFTGRDIDLSLWYRSLRDLTREYAQSSMQHSGENQPRFIHARTLNWAIIGGMKSIDRWCMTRYYSATKVKIRVLDSRINVRAWQGENEQQNCKQRHVGQGGRHLVSRFSCLELTNIITGIEKIIRTIIN